MQLWVIQLQEVAQGLISLPATQHTAQEYWLAFGLQPQVTAG
jgi:hypothetical protein